MSYSASFAERSPPELRATWTKSSKVFSPPIFRYSSRQIRDRDQSQDRQGARPHRAARASRSRRRGDRVRRREFITLLGGALAMVPSATFAQSGHLRLVGLLLSHFEGAQEANDRIGAIRSGLQKLGWTEGRNMRIEVRYANGNAERMRAQAMELVQLGPDVLIASATSSLAPCKKQPAPYHRVRAGD